MTAVQTLVQHAHLQTIGEHTGQATLHITSQPVHQDYSDLPVIAQAHEQKALKSEVWLAVIVRLSVPRTAHTHPAWTTSARLSLFSILNPLVYCLAVLRTAQPVNCAVNPCASLQDVIYVHRVQQPSYGNVHSIFIVCDGHQGPGAANHCVEHMPGLLNQLLPPHLPNWGNIRSVKTPQRTYC